MFELGSLFSSTKEAECTTQKCAQAGRKVVRLEWRPEMYVWCSDEVEIQGVTENYPDGEAIPVSICDRKDSAVGFGEVKPHVAGNQFQNKWKIVNVLPTRAGEGGYLPRREIDGRAVNARTSWALQMRFVNNQKKVDYRSVAVDYTRSGPDIKKEEETFQIYTNFWFGCQNYALTVYGDLQFVRGWGRWILELGVKGLAGGFEIYETEYHWGSTTKSQRYLVIGTGLSGNRLRRGGH